LINDRIYCGSPALAIKILHNYDVSFYFHDIEKEPLEEITRFSEKLNIKDKVTTVCGDSISAFLQDGYSFNQDDFIFIDPYQPFDSNKSGKTFFDVFIKAYNSHAKTFLWYGYDNLNDKNTIIGKLQSISNELDGALIHTFDVWQKSMEQNACRVNPGVPGCGIATAYLSEDSIRRIEEYMNIIGELYSHATYNDVNASLCTGYLRL
jgi:16S rRNA G966 N2-methylase RsmD